MRFLSPADTFPPDIAHQTPLQHAVVTILIADDNTRMRASTRALLTVMVPEDTIILEAADGAEAIAVYERTHPDWVLMDIVMEPVDGLVASRTIIAAHPEANVAILTNFDDAEYRKAAQEAGVRAFFPKERLTELPGMLLAWARDAQDTTR